MSPGCWRKPMKNSWSSPGGQQRMKIPGDIRRRWWHQKKIMISRDTRRGKRHLEKTTMPSSSASSFRPVDTSSLSSSATDWTLGQLMLSNIQTQGFTPKTSFDWICYSINVRMIWKDWNSDYVAEKPYLTPIKVGRWLVNVCISISPNQCWLAQCHWFNVCIFIINATITAIMIMVI